MGEIPLMFADQKGERITYTSGVALCQIVHHQQAPRYGNLSAVHSSPAGNCVDTQPDKLHVRVPGEADNCACQFQICLGPGSSGQ